MDLKPLANPQPVSKPRRPRQSYARDFKAQAVAACGQPGSSVAAIALDLRINANVLRRWIREAEHQRNAGATTGSGQREDQAGLPNQIEADASGLNMDERHALRQAKSWPMLAAMHAWLVAHRAGTATGSGLAKAIDYSLKRWAALTRYLEAGHLPIDNNPVENSIRPIALGRRNWLFAGSERAGRRAAAIQSLLATAKANGLEPHAWLKDTLEKLPEWPNSRIDELLPFRTPVANR